MTVYIHALREEGDSAHRVTSSTVSNFYPRPPRGGRRFGNTADSLLNSISIHALREEGDSSPGGLPRTPPYFYPRPPRGGRPLAGSAPPSCCKISIHALREEGDGSNSQERGGGKGFLSTPSARRATALMGALIAPRLNFYPRPPRGGRPSLRRFPCRCRWISIHALREEGDIKLRVPRFTTDKFLSTPSARRATT